MSKILFALPVLTGLLAATSLGQAATALGQDVSPTTADLPEDLFAQDVVDGADRAPQAPIARTADISALLVAAPMANGQDAKNAAPHIPPGMTPEMWLYLEEIRRRDNPQEAVRRKAEFRAAQRQNRLAARRWFGLSNLRPQSSHTPFMGTYSPYWSGNSWDPYRWIGHGHPHTAILIDRVPARY